VRKMITADGVIVIVQDAEVRETRELKMNAEQDELDQRLDVHPNYDPEGVKLQKQISRKPGMATKNIRHKNRRKTRTNIGRIANKNDGVKK